MPRRAALVRGQGSDLGAARYRHWPRYSGRKNAIFSRCPPPPLSLVFTPSSPSFRRPFALFECTLYVRRSTHFAVRPRLYLFFVTSPFIVVVDATWLLCVLGALRIGGPLPLRCLYPSSAILAREGSSATGEISPSSSSRHRPPTFYPLQSGSVAPKPHPLLQFILPCLSCLPARVARMTRRPFSPARRDAPVILLSSFLPLSVTFPDARALSFLLVSAAAACAVFFLCFLLSSRCLPDASHYSR